MRNPLKKQASFLGLIIAAFTFLPAGKFNTDSKSLTLSAYAANNDTAATEVENNLAVSATAELYSAVGLQQAGLNEDVFAKAIDGMEKLSQEGKVRNSNLITIIDFSQPSTQRRLYVVDLQKKKILFNTLVAHGRNSGTVMAKSFSNQASSLMSSPGFYSTAETYQGDNGYSLRLDGLEKNINDNARSRAVVMHGAPYVDQSHINSMGFIGRSWGCPAVPMAMRTDIINTIKGGSCLFIYTADASYQHASALMNI
jgi:hypothetical protein